MMSAFVKKRQFIIFMESSFASNVIFNYQTFKNNLPSHYLVRYVFITWKWACSCVKIDEKDPVQYETKERKEKLRNFLAFIDKQNNLKLMPIPLFLCGMGILSLVFTFYFLPYLSQRFWTWLLSCQNDERKKTNLKPTFSHCSIKILSVRIFLKSYFLLIRDQVKCLCNWTLLY